ncbi:EF hand domain-containing protein [Hoeflea halophila]|uniref:EF hand domain-containing protein n=1 Tax=Hoeflea halophila TaxID=714899 RepID=A0A286ID39_9HYPH|nr:hypothetical protein [Hoeflea halophila]SOE17991.1 EF hand domain-containing protein [Hoeflea halophila]
MKKTILATLAAALIASTAAPAFSAQDKGDGPRHGPRHGAPRIERMMERFDADRDGAVQLEEISAHHLAIFESVDTDKSGSLSTEELEAYGDMRKQERKEMREQRRAERKAMKDAAKEGGNMMDKRAERDGTKGDRDRQMAGKHDGKGHHGMRVGRLDADRNGEISREEFTALDTKMFARFDRNGDQKIDITDFYRDAKTSADAN